MSMSPAAQEMKSLNDTATAGLFWDPTGTSKSEFELRGSKNELLAKIWKVGQKGDQVLGRVAEGKWTFKRGGFLGRKILITADGEEKPSAVFSYKGIFGKGELKHSNGRIYKWERGKISGEQWLWRDDKENLILDFKQMRNIWTENCALTIPRDATVHALLPMLTLLGWFLILILARNEHSQARDDGRMYYEDKF